MVEYWSHVIWHTIQTHTHSKCWLLHFAKAVTSPLVPSESGIVWLLQTEQEGEAGRAGTQGWKREAVSMSLNVREERSVVSLLCASCLEPL